ncbi:hypothetical protein [Nonomuraea candida]|uniref:hypothetical protein n=1 Tax=Nonomuraea candida TaxID=359159 RepID=UPI0005BC363B|nr:hypothetical protein [Nonomuraea candida]
MRLPAAFAKTLYWALVLSVLVTAVFFVVTARRGPALDAYAISFRLQSFLGHDNADPKAFASKFSRVQLKVVVDESGERVTRLHSTMTGEPGSGGGGKKLVVHWAAPDDERTEFREDLCEIRRERISAKPTLEDVLLDAVGPLRPQEDAGGFSEDNGLYVRIKDGFRYELRLLPTGRTYTHVFMRDSRVVSVADDVVISEIAPEDVTGTYRPGTCPNGKEPGQSGVLS